MTILMQKQGAPTIALRRASGKEIYKILIGGICYAERYANKTGLLQVLEYLTQLEKEGYKAVFAQK